jgi:cell division protein FtsW (lipid II flippase)
VLLLLHCISAAYFVASGKRKSKQVKAACFLSLAACTCVMIALLFFEVCFAGTMERVDALMLMVPLIVCVIGDVLMYRMSVTKAYTVTDGNGARVRTRRRPIG